MWKQQILSFAKQFKHPAWGISHCKRVYELSLELSNLQHVANPTSSVEAVLFHDADTLDFMGAIGIARLLSIVGLDDWTPDLSSAVKLIQRFTQELPEKLHTSQAKEMGEVRQAEMAAYLAALSSETNGLEFL
jgi:HD superfamily phosphodiesterase